MKMKSESPGFSGPEFLGFTPETLTHNVAQINYPNCEKIADLEPMENSLPIP
jgi:hypothetical protein